MWVSCIVNAHKLWFITLASKAYQIDILGNHGSARMFHFLFRSDSAIYVLPMNTVRDHPFETSANFHDFWPLPSSVGSFLLLFIGKYGKFLTPPPLKNADVLNGWSLIASLPYTYVFPKRCKQFKSSIFYTKVLKGYKHRFNLNLSLF